MLKFTFADGGIQTLTPSKEFWSISKIRDHKGKTINISPQMKADDIRHDIGAVKVEIIKH